MKTQAKVRLFLAALGLALAFSLPIGIRAEETVPCSDDPEYQCCYYSVNGEHFQCDGLDPGCGCLHARVWTLN